MRRRGEAQMPLLPPKCNRLTAQPRRFRLRQMAAKQQELERAMVDLDAAKKYGEHQDEVGLPADRCPSGPSPERD